MQMYYSKGYQIIILLIICGWLRILYKEREVKILKLPKIRTDDSPDNLSKNSFKSLLDINILTKLDSSENMKDPENYNFLTIICNRKTEQNMSVNHEQLRHVNVMLKSAAMLTRSYLRFNMVIDSDSIQDNIESLVAKWPEEYKRRLLLSYHKPAFPLGTEIFRDKGQPCQTLDLWLHSMFPDLDAAIYIDTDVIFLTSPEELWEEFNHFNDMQLAAMAPGNFFGKHRKQESTGFNSGVIMMNLTRIRQYKQSPPLEGGWTSAMLRILKFYPKYNDQNVLNELFLQNQHLLYKLGCWWNFVTPLCKTGKPFISQMISENQSIALLHGNGGHFFLRDKIEMFKVVFKAFENHIIGSPVSELLTSLKQKLSESIKDKSSLCNQLEFFDDFLLMKLKNHI